MPSAFATATTPPKYSMTAEVCTAQVLAPPNHLSIGPPNPRGGMLFGMPTTVLGKRVYEIRRANGMGEKGQAASFARLIGITPVSLHNLESGESESLGKSLPGLLFKAHANPNFLLHGKGPPVLKDIERSLRAQTLVSMMLELEESEIDTIEHIVQTYIRAKPGASRNDPFKQNPPKKGGDHD